MSEVDVENIDSRLRDVFDKLRSGRHVSADDGVPYRALKSDYAKYRTLFEALGFDLVENERGFYYFRSTEDLGKEARQLAVFFFVLVEAWGETGNDLEATAFAAAGHGVSQLPHFNRDSWRQCMAEVGVTTEDELARIVVRLDRLGFAETSAIGRFRLRAPAWRFLDLCRELLAEADSQVDAKIAGEP